jgi:hypothetical protein
MQEKFITGYQWSPVDGKFISEYQFPDNKDKEEIHVAPYTTMEKPPVAPAGSAAFRRGDKWVVEADPSQVKTKPPIEDYFLLMPDYIQHLKNEGLWTSEDEQKRQDAIVENEKKQAEKQAEMQAALAAMQAKQEGGAA